MEEDLTVEQLIAKIKDRDPDVRAAAWLSAGKVGAAAVGPLADLMAEMDAELAQLAKGSGAGKDDKEQMAYLLEAGRAAKHGLWALVRHVGRPGAEDERKPVVGRLCNLLGGDQPVAVQREVLWMLSEIGADESVGPIARLLGHKDLREDARCALERLGGDKAVAALKAALAAAPDDFKMNIAQSLRARGVTVGALPCRKLVPTRKTRVKEAT